MLVGSQDWHKWCPSIRLLCNVGDDYSLDLRELAHEISRSNPDKYNEQETDKIFDVSAALPVDMIRKNIAHLRAQAKDKDKGQYFDG